MTISVYRSPDRHKKPARRDAAANASALARRPARSKLTTTTPLIRRSRRLQGKPPLPEDVVGAVRRSLRIRKFVDYKAQL